MNHNPNLAASSGAKPATSRDVQAAPGTQRSLIKCQESRSSSLRSKTVMLLCFSSDIKFTASPVSADGRAGGGHTVTQARTGWGASRALSSRLHDADLASNNYPPHEPRLPQRSVWRRLAPGQTRAASVTFHPPLAVGGTAREHFRI